MDNVIVASLFLLIALMLGIVAFTQLKQFEKIASILKKEKDMQETTVATVVETIEIRRRNQSFRWKNEYPILAYQINGKEYKYEATFAEKPKGKYQIGETYQIKYNANEPEICIVNDFIPTMKRTRTIGLVIGVIFALGTFNLTVSAIQVLFFGLESVL